MRPQDEIYAILALEVGGFAGGAYAAGEGYLFDAAQFPKVVELPEVAADAVDGVLADVAGVEDDEVGFFVGVDLGVACVQDHTPHAIGVVDVHLAAEGAYARGLGVPRGAGWSRPRLGLSGELYRGIIHTVPPARRRRPSRRSLRDGSGARAHPTLGSSPSPPALVYPRCRLFPPRRAQAPAHRPILASSSSSPPSPPSTPARSCQPALCPPATPAAPSSKITPGRACRPSSIIRSSWQIDVLCGFVKEWRGYVPGKRSRGSRRLRRRSGGGRGGWSGVGGRRTAGRVRAGCGYRMRPLW